ncbi:MAG: SDR family oxidoreductase [Gammaproteobacteria bacterium]
MPSTSSKVIIITGGAGGIGRAMARAIVDGGGRVAIMDRDGAAAQQFATELQERHGDGVALALVGDVASEADCNSAVARSVTHFGAMDGLINNAGIGVSSIRPDAERNAPSIMEITPELWRRFFDVNVTGAYLMTRAVIPHFLAQRWGRIVNITTSFFTMLRILPYGASKAALESASAIWAKEFTGTGVTVNVLVPGGPTDTPFVHDESGINRAKMLKPEIMGPPARWLTTTDSDGVTGQRFIAARWDATLTDDEAAHRAGSPIGWPDLARSTVVWPKD